MDNIYSAKPLLVNDGEKKYSINAGDIAYIIVSDNDCTLYSRNNRSICKVRATLGSLEECLSDKVFVRISRSTIINIWEVDFVMGRMVYMKSGMYHDIQKNRLEAVENHFVVLKENALPHEK